MVSASAIHLNVPPEGFGQVKVVFFDLMGTCLDWHSSIIKALPASDLLPSGSELEAVAWSGRLLTDQSRFALCWRQRFFEEIHGRFERGEALGDIDVTHRRVLDRLLHGIPWSEAQKQTAVRSWHSMCAWPDVAPALKRLKGKVQVFVLANGTTKLQLDLMRSSGLAFDMLFSSQLLGLTKPDPRIYEKAIELVGGGELEAEECLMVAAHVYDLRAAKELGMKTVYVERWTEDGEDDMELAKRGFDGFMDGKVEGETGGLARMAGSLGA